MQCINYICLKGDKRNMARPIKQGLDYFPLDVNLDDKIELLEAECGLQGFAIIIKLFQKIYNQGYFIKWTEDDQLLFAKKINTDLTTVNSVIMIALKREIFNKEMYENYRILTSKGIQRRFFEICKQLKRKGVEVNPKYLLIKIDGINNQKEEEKDIKEESKEGQEQQLEERQEIQEPEETKEKDEKINSEETPVNPEKTRINSAFSTQKKRKEKKYSSSRSSNTGENISSASSTASSEEQSDIFAYYKQKIGDLSDDARVLLQGFINHGMQNIVIKKAINEAIDNNAKTWSYIKTILLDCDNKKVFTEADFNKRQQEYESKKQEKHSKNKGKSSTQETGYQHYEQREYEDLEDLYANLPRDKK